MASGSLQPGYGYGNEIPNGIINVDNSADSGDLASPVHSRKTQIDATLEIIPGPVEKLRLTQTNSRQLIEVEKAEQPAKILQRSPIPTSDY
jgi:hypothetical protein